MAIPGNRHCASCIGALSFRIRQEPDSGCRSVCVKKYTLHPGHRREAGSGNVKLFVVQVFVVLSTYHRFRLMICNGRVSWAVGLRFPDTKRMKLNVKLQAA